MVKGVKILDQKYDKIFYIIRHGETEFNKIGTVQGRGINSDLNDIGKYQAERFYQMYKDIPFDKVYTSLLKRTHQTVELFLNDGIEWEQHSGFDELDWGVNEGKSYEKTIDSLESFTELISNWQQGNYNAKFTNGESPLEVSERQQEALDYVLNKQDEKYILVCMHGRAMRILLCKLLDIEYKFMDQFEHKNTSLYVLGYDGEEFELLANNSLEHLNHE